MLFQPLTTFWRRSWVNFHWEKKFTAQLVCRRWKDRSIVLLKQHKSVVLSCNRPWRVYALAHPCDEHPVHRENVITFEFYDMESWKQVLPFLPGIQFLYFDITQNVADEPLYCYYQRVTQLCCWDVWLSASMSLDSWSWRIRRGRWRWIS